MSDAASSQPQPVALTRADSGHLSHLANDLFEGILAPLVLGGKLQALPPIGGRHTLEFGDERTTTDINRFAHVQLVRSRIARKFAGVDRANPINGAQWAMAAVLNDLMQLSHPDLVSFLRPKAAIKLTQIARATALAIPQPASLAETIDRHTLFGRVLQPKRRDVTVRWWTGHATFRGTEPPARLLAWPQVRNVRQEEELTAWLTLPIPATPTDVHEAFAVWLNQSPLTALALATSTTPVFEFTGTVIGLVAQPQGRAVALRVLAANPNQPALNGALGGALRRLLANRAYAACMHLASLFGDRALREAQIAISADPVPKPLARAKSDDEALAFAFGANAARHFIGTSGEAFADHERRQLLELLAARTQTDEAKWLERELHGSV
jgi:hypothetical protein